MNKSLIQFIGIQIIVIGLILSVFEFLIDNSELIILTGIIVLICSFFLKKISSLFFKSFLTKPSPQRRH